MTPPPPITAILCKSKIKNSNFAIIFFTFFLVISISISKGHNRQSFLIVSDLLLTDHCYLIQNPLDGPYSS